MPFEVIPAIDIRGGLCVRLYQGDYSRETVFSDDPLAVAQRWAEAGVPRIHVVDLDGATAGHPESGDIIRRIAAKLATPIEVGGGLRTLEDINQTLGAGVDRVVLGTAAIEDPALVGEAVRLHGDHIVAGVDARGGLAATHGWKTQHKVRALDLIETMAKLGVIRVVYTDIGKDGVLGGPNYEAYRELVRHGAMKVIASGGVSSVEHLLRLADLGVEGAIVGRALYTGHVDLATALKAVSI